MKSSSASHEHAEDDDLRRCDDTTPTQPPATLDGSYWPVPSSRPSLLRSAQGRSSDKNKRSTDASEGGAVDPLRDQHSQVSDDNRGGTGIGQAAGTEEEKLAKLRDAVNAKLLSQQRMRRSYGPKVDQGAASRVSPISEEEFMATSSPSVDAAFASPDLPPRTSSTVSTESTESTQTIRASVPATPAGDQRPLRTPSYPFPIVPGTPRKWSSHFHQPFTTLSPTVTGLGDDHAGGGAGSASMASSASTPAATAQAFMPLGMSFPGTEDSRFPTPDLYDLVLQLNSEPGLEQWWAVVTNIMHDHFKADRATLVMPLDPTDIENVPWGQKAAFSMNGSEEFVPHRTVVEQTSHLPIIERTELTSKDPTVDTSSENRTQKSHPGRLRPIVEARHSYAGHGREARDLPKRPAGPQRTATHASGMAPITSSTRFLPRRLPSTGSVRHGSMSDPEFSSIGGGIDAGPYAEVFSSLRSLDHEVRPLIEPGGINRILDRGRVVTVTRDYVPDASESSSVDASVSGQEEAKADDSYEGAGRLAARVKLFGNYRAALAADNSASMLRDYEEYEQHPTSPWSQSPAPSPAVQAEEDVNPFFASEEQQVQDSFSPTDTPRDYSQFGQVEAIGVDRASTVVHIPLVHPTLSQPMQSLKTHARSGSKPGPPQRSNTFDSERMAPVAILSILSPAVPYPHNLTQSLKLLGPHLATSFAISQQFSSTHAQAVTIRHRRTASGHTASIAPMTIVPASLEDIINADLEDPPRSHSGSVTSPSDYSGRSKHSPASSILGTPGWDPASQGWTASKPAASTPGVTGIDMVDNYFDAKRRTSQRRGSNGSTQLHAASVKPATTKASALEGKSTPRKPSPNGKEESKDQKIKTGPLAKEEISPLRLHHGATDAVPASITEQISPRHPALRRSITSVSELKSSTSHSMLHSYGADVTASFGELQTQAQLAAQTPGSFKLAGHNRKPSYSEDMPPPSERLLRTIIDSVPVQIFTAEPDTGRLTWVNSKFLIYRGQEARQVLSEPWQAIHPDDRSEFMAMWHRSLRTAQQLQQKVRLERFDGSYRWFYVRAAPLKDKRQKIVHWFGTMMDFHEQHIAEANSARQQETAASEAKYRALANSSPQIVFAANRTKGVLFCNSQWLHFSGQTEAQALGVGFMDHVHPDDLAKCRLPTFEHGSSQPGNVPTSVPPEFHRNASASAASSSGSSETERGVSSSDSSPMTTQMPQRKLSELATTGILKISRDADGRPSYSTEVRLKSKDGEYRWHLVRLLLAGPMLQGEEDESEIWYGTGTDINDHKTLERDLKEAMDEKTRFMSNMSHEIRTPLNGITGMVNFLIDSNLTSEQMEHVNIIRASTEGLRGLINDILDLSKAEAGMIQLNMDWLFIRALIEEVNDLTSAMAIDKGLELNYLVEEDVPAQIKGDRFRIRQILLNIIGNAIKFTAKGEVFVRCSLRDGQDGELAMNEVLIKFEIIDTGRGFNDKEAEYLFKRFSQIDGSSTRQHGGTGLGLVISRQLAQLHGGDMWAKGAPGKGSTFAFTIKTTVPSRFDQPPPPVSTPAGISIPILPVSPDPSYSSTGGIRITKTSSVPKVPENQAKASPKLVFDKQMSASPLASPSPSFSSASSDPSLKSTTRAGSVRSERSSASSFMPPDVTIVSPPMKLALPTDSRRADQSDSASLEPVESSLATVMSGLDLTPPMYSILVVCPLKYSREATVQHIEKTLPKNIPHSITARDSFVECQQMLGGDEPVIFTHVVVVLQDVEEITEIVEQVLLSAAHYSTSIVIITDLAQRKKIMELLPQHDYNALEAERKLRFIFKPLKPSRFAIIFDPQKEREMSTDRNQDSAQQVALTQKQVFEELKRRLGNQDRKVLLVEDNKTNQLVVLKFLSKVSIKAETALDGVECTDKVFAQPYGYYSVILCDLHMPNKDGYQTCKEVRQWERQHKYPHLPIVALSANVLGDVYQKCVDAGFNSYLTKPIDFKELSTVLMTFMDPSDPSKPHEMMLKKGARRRSLAPGKDR